MIAPAAPKPPSQQLPFNVAKSAKLGTVTMQYTVKPAGAEPTVYPAETVGMFWMGSRNTQRFWNTTLDQVIAASQFKPTPNTSMRHFGYPPRDSTQTGRWTGGDVLPRSRAYAIIQGRTPDEFYRAPVSRGGPSESHEPMLELAPHRGTGEPYERTMSFQGVKTLLALVDESTVIRFTDGVATAKDAGTLFQAKKWVPDPPLPPKSSFLSGVQLPRGSTVGLDYQEEYVLPPQISSE